MSSRRIPLLALAVVPLLVAACGTAPGTGGSSPPPSTSASTPAQESAAAAATTVPPQPGRETAREDFADPSNHRFGTDGNGQATIKVSGGKYRMTLLRKGAPYGQLLDVADSPLTVSIALDMSMDSTDPKAWMGPVCFFQQMFGFSLKVHADGSYELVQVSVQGEDVATLVSGTVPAPSTRPLRLRLDCAWGMDQAEATAWIDGTQVGPATDVEASDNLLRQWAAVGFWASTPDPPTVVVIDDAVVTQVDE